MFTAFVRVICTFRPISVCNQVSKMQQKENKPCWKFTWFIRNSLYLHLRLLTPLPLLPQHLSSSFLAICCAKTELFLLLASSCFKCWTVKWQGSQCQYFRLTHIDHCVVVKTDWCLVRRHLNHSRADTANPVLGRVTKSTHWMPGVYLVLLLSDTRIQQTLLWKAGTNCHWLQQL